MALGKTDSPKGTDAFYKVCDKKLQIEIELRNGEKINSDIINIYI